MRKTTWSPWVPTQSGTVWGLEEGAAAVDKVWCRDFSHRPAPARYEYHLTEKGSELVDLLMVMAGWGDKWLAGEAGPPVLYRHHTCGEISSVELRCAHCGEPMRLGDVDLLPGPGAAVETSPHLSE